MNYSYDFENMPKGINVISLGDYYFKNNWWHKIFQTIEMDDLVVLEDGEAIKADNLCIVEEVLTWPVFTGYWFIGVRYRPLDQSYGIRDCELVFNNQEEAKKVKRGSIFNKTEQDLD